MGGGAVVVTGLAALVGKAWVKRLVAKEQATLDHKLEKLKAQLQIVAAEHSDALVRKRETYSHLATNMRILVAAPPSPEKRQERQDAFLAAYDQCSIWASEDVVNALGQLLDQLVKKNKESSVAQPELQSAYAKAILAMRRDSGFPDSRFEYRFVSF